jgi:hypothetical protein
LYTTKTCAKANKDGNGKFHTHKFNAITYYMPEGMILGVNQWHGDYDPINTPITHNCPDSIDHCTGGQYCIGVHPNKTIICAKCKRGTFSSEIRSKNTACDSCEAGTYQNETGKEGCMSCPAGKVANMDPNITKAIGVQTDRWNPVTGAFECLGPCPDGYQVDEEYSMHCEKCDFEDLSGNYFYGVGGSCSQCSAGTFTDAVGSTACKSCKKYPKSCPPPKTRQPKTDDDDDDKDNETILIASIVGGVVFLVAVVGGVNYYKNRLR